MKIYQLILICTFFIGSNLSLLEARGGGPGQGDYPVENNGFMPDSEWPDTNTTGMTYLNKIRTVQEKKFSPKKPSPTPLPQKSQKRLRQEQLEARIMKDLEPIIRKEVQEELAQKDDKDQTKKLRKNHQEGMENE